MTPYLPLVTRSYIRRVPLNSILYLRQLGRKIEVVTDRDAYQIYGRMEDMAVYMDGRFYEALKSLIINLDQVEGMEAERICFYNGEAIPMGRCNYIRVKQAYRDWLLK